MQQRLMLRRHPRRCRHRRHRLHALAFTRHHQTHAIVPQRPRPVRMSDHAHKSLDIGRKPRFTVICSSMIHLSPSCCRESRPIADSYQNEMTTDHIGPNSGVGRDYFYFPGDGFGYGYGLAVRTDPGNAKPPPPGLIGELKWDSGSGTYFGVDPKLDMLYILMEQTQPERERILPLFKKLVYDAFENSRR